MNATSIAFTLVWIAYLKYVRTLPSLLEGELISEESLGTGYSFESQICPWLSVYELLTYGRSSTAPEPPGLETTHIIFKLPLRGRPFTTCLLIPNSNTLLTCIMALLTDMPPEVVRLILEALTDVDLVSLFASCRTWKVFYTCKTIVSVEILYKFSVCHISPPFWIA